jgi:hypothetical protein
MPDEIPTNPGSVGKGVVMVFGWSVLAVFFGFVVPVLGSILLMGIGVVQAAWMIPIWRYYRRLGETETAKGVLIMAGIVFLLNAGCWGLIATVGIP